MVSREQVCLQGGIEKNRGVCGVEQCVGQYQATRAVDDRALESVRTPCSVECVGVRSKGRGKPPFTRLREVPYAGGEAGCIAEQGFPVWVG